MDLQERLEQCRKDKQAIEQQEKELLIQIEAKKQELKTGDVLVDGSTTVIVFKHPTILGYWNVYYEGGHVNVFTSQDIYHLGYEYQYNLFERKA